MNRDELHLTQQLKTLYLGSGVNFGPFVIMQPEIEVPAGMVCSTQPFFQGLASGFQRFQLMDAGEDFVGPGAEDRRIGQAQCGAVLGSGQFSRQPE